MMMMMMMMMMMTMMVLCPKAGLLAFMPLGDELSEVVSRCLSHRQLWVSNLSKVATQWLEVFSNLRQFSCKAQNIPLHHRTPAIYICYLKFRENAVAETWRRVWGERKNFSRTKISEWRFFRMKFLFSGQKFLMTFFSHRPGFRIFSFFSQIFHIFTMLHVIYDPFLTRKTPFFTLFILSHASDNTTSQNIGGTDAWTVPPPQILGDRPAQFPLGLRWVCLNEEIKWKVLVLQN